MKCILCKRGETKPGSVTTSLQRGETVVIVKEVPADVCQECGEYYLAEEVSRRTLELADQAVKNKAEVEIIRYAA
jgi:YgiT-type zinc finger domain-containing protein